MNFSAARAGDWNEDRSKGLPLLRRPRRVVIGANAGYWFSICNFTSGAKRKRMRLP